MGVVKRDTGRVSMKTMVVCRSPGWIGSYFPCLLGFILCMSPVLFIIKV